MALQVLTEVGTGLLWFGILLYLTSEIINENEK